MGNSRLEQRKTHYDDLESHISMTCYISIISDELVENQLYSTFTQFITVNALTESVF